MSVEPWNPLAKLINPDGSAAQTFITWSAQLIAAQKAAEKQLAALTTQQQTAQQTANTVAETAAAALEDTTGATAQERSAEMPADVGAAWFIGPAVTFSSAVAVGHVTSEDSGPIYYAYFSAPYINGEVRLVKIVGVTETILATQGFSATVEDSSLGFGSFGYDAAGAETGAVSYRVDARTFGGTIYGLGLKTHIKRAP